MVFEAGVQALVTTTKKWRTAPFTSSAKGLGYFELEVLVAWFCVNWHPQHVVADRDDTSRWLALRHGIIILILAAANHQLCASAASLNILHRPT